MPRIVVALLLAALAGGCGDDNGPPGVITQHQIAPRQVDLEVRSAALGETAKVRLLTPEGWTPSARRQWPVLYLLHGCCDSYKSWTRSTDIARLPELRDVLVVMPEGGDIGFYSNWRDGPRWEDFHLRELPRILAPYGAGKRRAIAGLSMGGLGAMVYAARRPRRFEAAASFSGVLNPLGAPAFWLGLFSRYTDDPRAVWGDPARDRAAWRRHDPTALVPALAGIRLFVSAGDGRPGPFERGEGETDALEAEVGAETRAFVERARALGVPVQASLYGAGFHAWPYYQRELHRALPLLLGAIR
jgi:diacylglycerol O-acyltransferase / trehalose O-mycolyltransferase / mycolyltransferase Ag85